MANVNKRGRRPDSADESPITSEGAGVQPVSQHSREGRATGAHRKPRRRAIRLAIFGARGLVPAKHHYPLAAVELCAPAGDCRSRRHALGPIGLARLALSGERDGHQVNDRKGRPVLSIASLRGNRALAMILCNYSNLGRFDLYGVKLSAVVPTMATTSKTSCQSTSRTKPAQAAREEIIDRFCRRRADCRRQHFDHRPTIRPDLADNEIRLGVRYALEAANGPSTACRDRLEKLSGNDFWRGRLALLGSRDGDAANGPGRCGHDRGHDESGRRPMRNQSPCFRLPPGRLPKARQSVLSRNHAHRAALDPSPAGLSGKEKGDSPHLPERPGGCFAQMGTVPFFLEGDLALENFRWPRPPCSRTCFASIICASLARRRARATGWRLKRRRSIVTLARRPSRALCRWAGKTGFRSPRSHASGRT